jgi:lipid II:glycine glycyltransferase (peptidoglycan interpeptide bridge formation enzyme)
MKYTSIENDNAWNQIITSLPEANLLQSWEWGQLKARYGWHAHRLVWGEVDEPPQAAAQILQRHLELPGIPLKLNVLYCPRGPVLDWTKETLRDRVLQDLAAFARRQRAISLKVDPFLPIGYGMPGEPDAEEVPIGKKIIEEFSHLGWRFSDEQIQFRNTLTLDLRDPEDQLLGAMKSKTRYNIRLAGRRGVEVQKGGPEDIDLLYKMYTETSLRDGFAIRNPGYYQHAWGDFMRSGLAQPFLAFVEKEPIAALIVYRFDETVTFMFGMSRDIHREKMPNYLLQWEAIRWAKEHGCSLYDFWGAPDWLDPQDPMWGVYRFKKGFGARLVRTIGAWDFPTRRYSYWVYSILKPRLMNLLRFRNRIQTRQMFE